MAGCRVVNCPKCDGASKVITTRNVKDQPDAKCRYRHCVECRHRWYSLAPAETALADGDVNWSYDLLIINQKDLPCA